MQKTRQEYRADESVKPGFIVRTDAGESLFLSRDLEYIMAETYEVELAPLRFFELVPVDNSVPVGAQRVTYRQLTRIGVARLGNQPDSTVPRVDLFMEEFSHPVHEIHVAYGYSLRELEAAQYSGMGLEAEKAETARRAVAELAHSIALDGDDNTGLNGLFNDANVPNAAAPTGTWSTATADQILGDMSDAVSDVLVATKGRVAPDTMRMPIAQYNRIQDLRVGDTNETVLSYFLRTNPHIKTIDWLDELAQVDLGGGPTDLLWVYKNDMKHLKYVMPLPFQQLPAQEKNFEIVINCRESSGGLIIPKPLSMKLVTGI